jgi:phosphonate transport system substrate-binding protein
VKKIINSSLVAMALWISLVLLFTIVAACTREDPLTFVVIPSEDAATTKGQWAPMVEYLSDGMNKEIELMIVSDYSAVVEAMRYGHADIARFSAAGYVMALEEGATIEPIVAGVKKETGLPGYYAMLIALADTDTSDLAALTFGFVDVGSTSGYIAPSVYLEGEGIIPARVLFAGSHNAVILAVKNGSVGVGAVASNRVAVAIEEGVLDEGEYKIVWQSPLIPNCPIAVQSEMAQRDRDTLKELFLNAPLDIVAGVGTNEIGYVETDDAVYDPVREIIRYKNQ